MATARNLLEQLHDLLLAYESAPSEDAKKMLFLKCIETNATDWEIINV